MAYSCLFVNILKDFIYFLLQNVVYSDNYMYFCYLIVKAIAHYYGKN